MLNNKTKHNGGLSVPPRVNLLGGGSSCMALMDCSLLCFGPVGGGTENYLPGWLNH